MKGRDLAEFANLDVLGDPRLFDNSKIEVVCLRDRLDADGTGMITLNYDSQRREGRSMTQKLVGYLQGRCRECRKPSRCIISDLPDKA